MRLKKRRKTSYLLIMCLILFFTRCIVRNIGKKLSYHIENIVIKNVDREVYNNIFFSFNSDELGNEELLNIINLNMNKDGEVVSVDYKMNIAYKYLSNSIMISNKMEVLKYLHSYFKLFYFSKSS